MQKVLMVLGAILAWAVPALAATHDGVQLWENGPLWAKTNIGANSPTETGYYFWWGDTLGYKWQNNQWVASDGSGAVVTFNSPNATTAQETLAQLQSMGAVGTDGNLLPAFDAAEQQWGDGWRLPKASELRNLMELCSWNWSTNSGVVGYTVTGKGLYTGNSIFLPAAGNGSNGTIHGLTTEIYLWSATCVETNSLRFQFSSTNRNGYDTVYRGAGTSLRPVKSLTASKQSAAAALDTRTGTRTVSAKESIAYDAAWGDATSGTLTVNGTAVSGLSKTGTYAWTPNTSQTNYWKLAYKAGTANYAATFQSLDKYTITYAETKGAANSNPTQYNILDSITFAALPNVTGYTFKGWNPTKIAAGGFGAKTVTAQWTPITFTVKFNANGGTGTMANESFTYDTAKALTANAFTRTGYTFKGWATSSGATSAAYTDKQSVKNLTTTSGATVNLYAVWQVNTYSVKFNANGGSGSMTALGCTYGQNATLTANAFTRTGYAFLGWATSASGTVVYKNGVSVKNLSAAANATVNLYAKWTDTWYVNAATGNDANEGASAADPFKTIQHAIDLTVPGMTIIVADGTYAPINSGNKSITIRSVNGAAKTIIDGGKTAMCARLANWSATASMTNTVLRGFRLQNGYSTLDAGGVQGGTLHDCHVVSNRAVRTGGGTCYSALYNCVVEGNSCGNLGGGSYLPTAFDCTFVGNTCATNGAGVCSGVLIDCTVISNRTERDGGGAYNSTMTNCVVLSNTALNIGGGIHKGSLYSCIVSNNTAYVSAGGVYDAMSTKCTIADNRAYNNGGGLHSGSATDCIIALNVATQTGGGVYNATLNRCTIRENSAGGNGGGAFLAYASNCLFIHNTTAATGGGVHKGVLNNCTVYGNVANSAGGVDGLGGLTEVSTNNNCIVWGNSANEYPDVEPSKMVLHNCYTNDPHFIRAEAGDFRLRCDSPCIDAGDKTYVTNTVDFAGNPRIVNNKVDIGAYEFSAALDQHFTVQVTNGTGGAIYYEGDTVTIAAEDRSPRYTFTRWTGDVSVLKNVNSMTNTFTMSTRNLAFTAEYDDLQQYLVIDLSGGVNATSYPVSYLTDVPAGGWTDTYKTTKLVMRRIDPGTFTMGSPTGEAGRTKNESQHQERLTHSYYIGVFELTQRQWELVMGTRPSAFSNTVNYATRPVERVSYNQIRGAELGQWWPQMNAVDEASFMGKLRAKTGRLFDLPTEAQWEYACRAGTMTALNSGKDLVAASGVDANMAEVGRYYYNSGRYNNTSDFGGDTGTGTAKVGSYLGNAWGLYDMHGNVGEICLDWYDQGETSDVLHEGVQLWENGPLWAKTNVGANSPTEKGYYFWWGDVVGYKWQNSQWIASDGSVNGFSFSSDNCLTCGKTAAQLRTMGVIDALGNLLPAYDAAAVQWGQGWRMPTVEEVRNLLNLCTATRTTVDGVAGFMVTGDGALAENSVFLPGAGYGEGTAKAGSSWTYIWSSTEGGGTASYRAMLKDWNTCSDINRYPGLSIRPVKSVTDPVGPDSGKGRSLRGGDWSVYSYWCRSAARGLYSAGVSSTAMEPGIGLRPVINFANFSLNQVVNLQASNGTEPNGVRLSWTAVPGATEYMVYNSTTENFADAQRNSNAITTNTYLSTVKDTDTHWYWVQAVVDGKPGMISEVATGYRVLYSLTVSGGEGSKDCFGNTSVTIKANAAPTGYTFKEWTGAAADVALLANKTAASTTLTMPGRAVTLTATYQPNAYAVKFNANGGTGTMANEAFVYDTAKALTANAFTRTGYTFKGWATTASGAVAHADKASVKNLTATANGTVNLYAVWQANAYTVKFNASGGTGTMANESFTYDTAKALTANAFTRTGYTFQGWATSASGAVAHADKASVKNLTTTANGTVNLYAVWTANPYTVTFDANGGEGSTMGTQDFAYGTAQNLPAVGYARTGYTFLGWSTNPTATAATYADGASVSNLATGGTLKLYAVWRPNTCTVRFLPNGAEGTMADQTLTYDTATNLTANAFTKAGFGFVGWCAEGETAVSYTNRQTVVNLATDDGAVVTLTAKWADTWYVDATAGNDANEGVAPDQAFQTIQHAIDQSVDGMTIVVADGTYAPIRTDNRSITIRSVNGAEKTFIDGEGADMCALLGDWPMPCTNTVLRGFTLRNGYSALDGGGTRGGELHNCYIVSNRAARSGGGTCYSTLYSCVVENNICGLNGGGSHSATAYGCSFVKNRATNDGAGVYSSTLVNCTVVSNRAEYSGGGTFNAKVDHSAILDNEAKNGGGAFGGVLTDCVVSNNLAHLSGGGLYGADGVRCVIAHNQIGESECYGGGAFRGSLQDCLVYGNRIVGSKGNGSGVSVAVCRNCTIYGNTGGTLGVHAWLVNDQPGGTNYNCIVYGNTGTTQIDTRMASFNCFTRDPMFVDAANGDFRLQGASPCIDMGNNKYVSGETDIRGNARIQNGVVDLGAYEYTLPTALGNVPVEGTDAAVPVEWLGLYGYVDEDATPASLQAVLKQTGDNGVPLWESWVAGFDPWDPDSQLTAEIEMVDGEPVVSWSPDMSAAEPKRHYTVMGKTNLTDAAWIIPVNEAHRFFKVQVTMGEPGRVTEVAATAGTSADGVTLSWRAADGALGYNVYRATVDDFDRATLVASVSDAAYVDTTAVPGVEYHYWIVSVANGGEWLTSEGATGHRNIGVPQQVVASDGTATDWITVTWTAVDGAISYRVLRATSDDVAAAVAVGTSAGTSWMDRDVDCGTVYTYWVVAVGANITGEASASDEGYLRLPAPTEVTASNGAFGDRVRIAWAEVPAASHYRVYRSTTASGSKTPISGWQTARTYSDTTAEAGKTYYYFVAAALDAEGLNASAYSTGAVGSLKVGTPTGVYATDGTSSTGVTVSWQAVVGADGYTVYRGTVNDPAAAQVLATTAATSFEDTTAEPGTLYFYWVAATNAVSAGEKSAGETGFRSLGAPTGVTATSKSGTDAVTVSWQPVAGAVSYRIFRGTRSGEAYAVEIDTTTETSYADESVAAGRTYYYSVIAVGATCESGFSAFVAGSR